MEGGYKKLSIIIIIIKKNLKFLHWKRAQKTPPTSSSSLPPPRLPLLHPPLNSSCNRKSDAQMPGGFAALRISSSGHVGKGTSTFSIILSYWIHGKWGNGSSWCPRPWVLQNFIKLVYLDSDGLIPFLFVVWIRFLFIRRGDWEDEWVYGWWSSSSECTITSSSLLAVEVVVVIIGGFDKWTLKRRGSDYHFIGWIWE